MQPPYSASSVQRTDSISQDGSNNTNSFAILDRAADSIQSPGFNRQRPQIILNQILYASAL
eukprot:4045387-Pyramimonas_sp.AAC.1